MHRWHHGCLLNQNITQEGGNYWSGIFHAKLQTPHSWEFSDPGWARFSNHKEAVCPGAFYYSGIEWEKGQRRLLEDSVPFPWEVVLAFYALDGHFVSRMVVVSIYLFYTPGGSLYVEGLGNIFLKSTVIGYLSLHIDFWIYYLQAITIYGLFDFSHVIIEIGALHALYAFRVGLLGQRLTFVLINEEVWVETIKVFSCW